MRGIKHIRIRAGIACLLMLLVFAMKAYTQQKSYTIRDGKMYIQLPKKITGPELDSFVKQFNLSDLDLSYFIRTGIEDSLKKMGWDININNETGVVISKQLFAVDEIINPGHKILFSQDNPDFSQRFPAVSNAVQFGYNRVRNRYQFVVNDSIVRFFLKGHASASRVMLAGSFNNWMPDALMMTETDSGWIADVRLSPGKYWYKFIPDGNWMVDPDNLIKENDGQGNINSVFFKTNVVFNLEGFSDAKQVYLSGSFNKWKPRELSMVKTANGWTLPVYLANGTHSYKFVVDGKWLPDEKNEKRIPDGHGGFNSIISIGKPHLFTLKGFENAGKVMLVGSFNGWRDSDLSMEKIPGGWQLPYVISAGNHEYKFKVDDKWISDPANPVKVKDGNSFLVVEPNYSFRLKNYGQAGKVMLSGDFNGWDANGIMMNKEGDDWVFSLHLAPGKVRYKFFVDGKWIIDPDNKQWEQNEFGTKNSIIWIEK